MPSDLWNLVLAAGAGKRLAPVTGGIPKQYWRAGRRHSLLDDTINRMAPLAPAARTVTVVADAHRQHLSALRAPGRLGQIVFQPEDRGTAAGVLLGLLHIIETAPKAIVVLTPSDHGVRDIRAFQAGIDRAARSIRDRATETVVFGVEAESAHGDYGWITPAPSETRALHRVAAFIEKPPLPMAEQLLASGAVWNTMIVVARATTLLTSFRYHLPHLSKVLESAMAAPHAVRHNELRAAYDRLPHYDFSRDLLTPATDLSLIVWPTALGWSDLGTPERLAEWHDRSRARSRIRSSVSL